MKKMQETTKGKWKRAGGFQTIPTIDIRDEKNQFEGHYLRSKTIESDKFETGKGTLHEFMTTDGELVGAWGSGQLDFKLKNLLDEDKAGVLVRIEYKGKSKFKNKKGKVLQAHAFDVLYDEGTRIEVPAQ